VSDALRARDACKLPGAGHRLGLWATSARPLCFTHSTQRVPGAGCRLGLWATSARPLYYTHSTQHVPGAGAPLGHRPCLRHLGLCAAHWAHTGLVIILALSPSSWPFRHRLGPLAIVLAPLPLSSFAALQKPTLWVLLQALVAAACAPPAW